MALWGPQKQGKSYLDSAELAMLKGVPSAPSQRQVGRQNADRLRGAGLKTAVDSSDAGRHLDQLWE